MIASGAVMSAFRKAGRFVTVYAGWLFSSLVGLYAMLKAWEAIKLAYVALRLGKWGYGAASNFAILLLGLAWLVGALYVESYYREGADQNLLLRRFLRVTLVELGILALTFSVIALAM